MASKKRTPPVFSENMLYKTWRNKIDMWQLDTSVPKKEQAIIILLDSLEGNAKAEKAVSDLTATELNNGEGINTLFTKPNLVLKDETVDEAYITYSNFISFNKTRQNEYD